MLVLYTHTIHTMTTLHKMISVTIPEELLKKVDVERQDVPRSKFIVRALETKLATED